MSFLKDFLNWTVENPANLALVVTILLAPFFFLVARADAKKEYIRRTAEEEYEKWKKERGLG